MQRARELLQATSSVAALSILGQLARLVHAHSFFSVNVLKEFVYVMELDNGGAGASDTGSDVQETQLCLYAPEGSPVPPGSAAIPTVDTTNKRVSFVLRLKSREMSAVFPLQYQYEGEKTISVWGDAAPPDVLIQTLQQLVLSAHVNSGKGLLATVVDGLRGMTMEKLLQISARNFM